MANQQLLTVATGAESLLQVPVPEGQRLIAVSASAEAATPSVFCTISVGRPTNTITLVEGFVRGGGVNGPAGGLQRYLSHKIRDDYNLSLTVRNDSGATVTIFFEWEIERTP